MYLEELNIKELTLLVKTFVDKHEANKKNNPQYNDPELREFVSHYESFEKVESKKSYKRGISVTETDCGVYGLYMKYKFKKDKEYKYQPVVKFKFLKSLYGKRVMEDLHKYLNS